MNTTPTRQARAEHLHQCKDYKNSRRGHQHNPNKQNLPNLPVGEADGLGNVADVLTIHTDVQSDKNDHL